MCYFFIYIYIFFFLGGLPFQKTCFVKVMAFADVTFTDSGSSM